MRATAAVVTKVRTRKSSFLPAGVRGTDIDASLLIRVRRNRMAFGEKTLAGKKSCFFVYRPQRGGRSRLPGQNVCGPESSDPKQGSPPHRRGLRHAVTLSLTVWEKRAKLSKNG